MNMSVPTPHTDATDIAIKALVPMLLLVVSAFGCVDAEMFKLVGFDIGNTDKADEEGFSVFRGAMT